MNAAENAVAEEEINKEETKIKEAEKEDANTV